VTCPAVASPWNADALKKECEPYNDSVATRTSTSVRE
jgi:hypothetical protein